ncbi:MAG: anthranilate synthase component I family protein [Deltaproteobacteria bacterium]|nr:anthranilate synthase component I family protein [Deltaproteobacteria bacterium]
MGASGRVVPIIGEILADQLTPVAAFASVAKGRHAYLLESVEGGEKWGRYSFIGVDPDVVFRARGSRVELERLEGTTVLEADPLRALEEILLEHRPVEAALPAGLPRFWGGAVGYLGYDLVRGIEHIGTKNPETSEHDAVLAIGGTLLVFDGLRQTVQVIVPARVGADSDAAWDRAAARIEEVAGRLNEPPRLRSLTPPSGPGLQPELGDASMDERGFREAVGRAREYIRAGDIIQVVLSRRFTAARCGTDPLDVYRMMRVINPSPYMFFLRFPERSVVGASPEVMVRRTGGEVELRPIAGTRRRGATPEDDARMAAELLADPKERAEHVMLLDLGRNDLGRLSVPGGVEVTERMVIERYSHVMHLVSNVVGHVRPGVGPFDVIRATLPAGTLSGAPKVRAMQIIEELEPCRRGIYGGAVGYVGFDGNLDLAIAIRTIVAEADELVVQAGAGIVWDSDPERELAEVASKARAPFAAIAAARG